MCFPSWSWLGWKVELAEAGETKRGPKIELFGLTSTESPFSSRRPGIFENHLDARVESPDSTVIAWKATKHLSKANSTKGKTQDIYISKAGHLISP